MAELFHAERKYIMNHLLDFVKELSFVRVGGSAQEKQAAEMIIREIRKAAKAAGRDDIEAEVLPFDIPDADVEQCTVTAAGREIPSAPFLCSGNIDRECRLLYLDDATEIDFSGVGNLSDTAVLLNELMDEDVYKRLAAHHAAAFLVLKGKYYYTAEEASLYPKELREQYRRHGAIPGFWITAADAAALLNEETEMIHLTLQQKEKTTDSQNISVVIKGTDLAEESIILTAHYDSVPLGTGSWDNATGATALLAIFSHFAAHPPRRTLRFLWCGSEERGLLGSRTFAAQNEELLDQIQFCFNFDMCGTTLGANDIFVTGEKDLETFIQQYCHLNGYSAKLRVGVQSSDSVPFCYRGIPALGLSRGTRTAEIHTIHDLLPTLNEKAIQKNVAFAIKIISDFANAAVLPVKRVLSEERKKELERFF